MNEENANIIELEDENGETVKFEHLLTYEYGENFYAAMLPVDDVPDMEEGEVLLFRLEEDGDADMLMPIETEEELEGAWNAFMEEYYGDEDAEEGEEGEEAGCTSCEGCGCGCKKD